MCINPKHFNGATIPCRMCWQCRSNMVSDWVGRCIAENKVSGRTLAFSVTYGRNPRMLSADHPHADKLVYADVQAWLNRLRKSVAPEPMRFFVTGERGSTKGRTHWHLIAFFKKRLPPNLVFKTEKFLHGWQEEVHGTWSSGKLFWEHGFTYIDEGDAAGIQYIAKYILKSKYDLFAEKSVGMSSKPPLGARYFESLAARYVTQGLAPRDFFYSFPDVYAQDGSKRQFMLQGRSRDNYLRSFVKSWVAEYGDEPWPQSEILDEFCEREAASVLPAEDLGNLITRFLQKREEFKQWPVNPVRESPDLAVRREFLNAWHNALRFQREQNKGT